jgi:hypothetical protein
MDSAALRLLREQLAAALDTVDQALEHADRRCHDCRRRADDLTQGADGEWRGPNCRRRHEAGAGGQLPIGGAS